jgi:hypothetical protein
MKRVVITQSQKDAFLQMVHNLFRGGKLEKKSNNKILWSTTKEKIDALLVKKLKGFDSEITFDKLITAEFDYLSDLKSYIEQHAERTKLSKNEKDYFLTLYDRLKKSDYVDMLGVDTCLYCNRNFVFNFKKGKHLHATAQIDHFYDKKHYPYFAVSLYNLIPSCSTCNQRKSTKEANIIHPFVESFDQKARFVLHVKNSRFYQSTDGFNIKLDTEDPKAKASIDMFNLERLYQHHKDIVLEMLQREAIYNESYLDELYHKYEGTLFKNREDLMLLVHGGYVDEEQINKRPLSKLVKDISAELGLI